MKSSSPQRVLRSLPLSSVNHGKKEGAKAQKISPAPVRPAFTHGTMLSSVRKLLLNSRLMLESLEYTEELLAAIQPEIIDLCLSPQEGPEKVAAAPPQPFVETTSTPDDKARLPSSFSTSPMNATQLMFETATTEECTATASLQTLRGIVTEMIWIKQRMENNVKLICQTSKERETLMVLIQEKTMENAELISLMIEISDKQALMSDELEGEDARKMSKEARNKKREMVRMYARVLEWESQAIHLL